MFCFCVFRFLLILGWKGDRAYHFTCFVVPVVIVKYGLSDRRIFVPFYYLYASDGGGWGKWGWCSFRVWYFIELSVLPSALGDEF